MAKLWDFERVDLDEASSGILGREVAQAGLTKGADPPDWENRSAQWCRQA